MFFLNPTYLWALFGLLIPIAIHLWSKKEGKTIKIGSIKLLLEEESKQSSSIQLNELLLLFLRVSLMALIVLILAGPQLKKESINVPLTYLVEPALLTNENMVVLIDGLKEESEVLLLRETFPELNDVTSEISDYEIPNYWQLAKDMETLKTDSIIVFTRALGSGLTGKRPTINKHIEWVTFEGEDSEEAVIEAALKEETIQLLSVISTSEHLIFKKEKLPLNSQKIAINSSQDSLTISRNGASIKFTLTKEEPLKILLFHTKIFDNEAIYLEAGLTAISKHIERPIDIIKTSDSIDLDLSAYQYIVWFNGHEKIIPQVRTLYYQTDELANTIIQEGPSTHDFYITKPLNLENVIDEHFSEALLSWLNLHPDLDKKIKPLDKRVISKAELLPHYKGSALNISDIKTLSISKWLWILVAFLLVIERVVAHLRKQ